MSIWCGPGKPAEPWIRFLFRLAEFLEKQLALKNKVTNAILYPAIMLVVGTLVLFFLVTFVVPKITAVFAHSKQALPWPTIVLMEISQFCSDYWMVLLAGILRACGDSAGSSKTETGHVLADRLLLKLPLIGQVARMVSISRLSQYAGHDAVERRAIIRGARCSETGHEQPRARASRRRRPGRTSVREKRSQNP